MSASVTIRSITPAGSATCTLHTPWWETTVGEMHWWRCKYQVTILDPTIYASADRAIVTITRTVTDHPSQTETYTTSPDQDGLFTLQYWWYDPESEPSATFVIDIEVPRIPQSTGILCDSASHLILCDYATGAVLHGVTS